MIATILWRAVGRDELLCKRVKGVNNDDETVSPSWKSRADKSRLINQLRTAIVNSYLINVASNVKVSKHCFPKWIFVIYIFQGFFFDIMSVDT